MKPVINRERLADTFTRLCEISSPSRNEKAIAAYLRESFLALGADEVIEDQSQEVTGSNSGNLIVRFNPTLSDVPGLFFACHMDTVQPGDGVEVVRHGDLFTSRGDTILGGDDKSGIAALLEMIATIKEQGSDHPMIEIVLTTCEEVGLLGAKALDHRQLKTEYGYALDSTGIDMVVTGAPAANKFKVQVHGLAAHAGLNPEKGINAIQVAAKAIADQRLGRLDEESTANFGIISGGVATNIVPDLVTLEGEVRSHDIHKLDLYTREIEAAFRKTIDTWRNPFGPKKGRPAIDITTIAEYPAMNLAADSAVLARIRKAGRRLGRKLRFIVAGGGSDANILNSYGLDTAIIATGMSKVHTTEEQMDLNDLVSITELIYSLVMTR